VARMKKGPVDRNSFWNDIGISLHLDQFRNVTFATRTPRDPGNAHEYYIYWKVKESYLSRNIIQEWRRSSLEENNEWPCVWSIVRFCVSELLLQCNLISFVFLRCSTGVPC
jgi:hypothetical protein